MTPPHNSRDTVAESATTVEAGATPHPTAIRLARSAALIAAAGHGVGFYALAACGFSIDEVAEHAGAADQLLNP